jgi:hypothetical protein
MSKLQAWYDSLPEHTKQYLKSQPLWHDSDMWRAGIFGLVVGFILGAML